MRRKCLAAVELKTNSRDTARYPAQFTGERCFYDIVIISLFYQKIINVS